MLNVNATMASVVATTATPPLSPSLSPRASRRPAVLDISHLLCSTDPSPSCPPLSPSTTSSSTPSTTPSPISSTTPADSFLPSVWCKDQGLCHERGPSFPTNTNLSGLYSAPSQTISPARPVHPSSHTAPQHHSRSSSSSSSSSSLTESSQPLQLKAKRRRANAKQLEVLNRVFDRTFFPSTQLRAELGRQLGMSSRTVQIWFQNRRQAMRTRERQHMVRTQSPSSTSSFD